MGFDRWGIRRDLDEIERTLIYAEVELRRMPTSPAPKGKRREDYLRTIYELQRSLGSVRARDVSGALGVSMPTAVEELKALNREGLIRYSRGSVALAGEAERVAEGLDRKRGILKEFLELVLEADPGEAERVACYLEHFTSDELLGRMEDMLEFARDCEREFAEFMGMVRDHRAGRGDPCRRGGPA
jgi:Mn-dependent DtxR family transcriptional regulator